MAAEHDVKWRRACGCMRTSDKLKQMLKMFPNPPPPPPTPSNALVPQKLIATHNGGDQQVSKPWLLVAELISLLQLSVTATALALYYLIYCYMQMVYFALRSAVYFHHADGLMKLTIGIVTITSMVIAFQLIIRLEMMLGLWNH